jgi:hypothetical protein
MRYHRLLVVAPLALILALAVPALAQSDRGAMTGTVRDPGGAVVADAKVTITNVETNEVREVETNGEGAYTAPQLQAATYRMTVTAPGFKTASFDDIKIAVQVTRTVDVELEVGEVGESVTVSADDIPVIQTDTPVQQLNVTERQVRELQLLVAAESGGRSPLAFIFLDSSVTGTSSGATGTNATSFRINGGQGLGTDILIDGAGTKRAENGTYFSEVAPGPNAFQEFTVSTSSFSAEFGQSTGGVVNFTIKTGGNELHGEGYFFLINEALNANIDLNRIQDLEKPRDRQRDYGFSIGGPVVIPWLYNGKDKTFFFFNYGAYRTTQSESVIITVPTAKMRTGDFSELLTDPYVLQFFGGPVRIFDPSQPVGQRTQIPGNRLDLYQGGSLLSPIGINFVNLFPLPNQTGPLGSSVFHNYLAQSEAPAETDYFVTKITQTITDRQVLNVSYTYRTLPSTKGGFPRFPLPWVQQGVWAQQFKSHFARLQHDYTITPSLLNHFNAGWTRANVENRNFTSGMPVSELGLSPFATQNFGLPLVGFPGYGDILTGNDPRAYQPGGSTFFDNEVGDNTVQISDSVTYLRGRHTFKGGADIRIQQMNNSAHFDIGGNFNFRSNQTGNVQDFTEGWPVASLVTGRPEFSFNSLQSYDPGFRFFTQSYFFQDDWKVTDRLTLNLGLRYDYGRPREETNDVLRGFDPFAANPDAGGRPGAIVSVDASNGGIQSPYPGLVEPDRTNWGPRVGFAYSIDQKTVVRGGYGLYYAPVLYNDFGNTGLLGYNPGAVNINGGLDAFITLENYPSLPAVDPTTQAVGQLDRNDIDFFDVNYRTGRTAQWSLDVQRELPLNIAITVGYVGHKGTRLRSNFNPLNALPFDALRLGLPLLSKRLADVTPVERQYAASLGFPLPTNPDSIYPGFSVQGGANAQTVAQALKPFPQYGIINSRLQSEGQSSYHALKIDVQRRFAQGFQFGLSYTHAKLITDAAEDLFGDSPLNGVVQNPHNRRALRAESPNSLPHSLVLNYIVELPFGSGKRLLDHDGWVNRVVGGWQFSGIHRYRSGPAVTPFIDGGQRDFLTLVGYGGNLRPNIVPGVPFYTSIPAGGVSYRYLSPLAFVRPPDFRGPLVNGLPQPIPIEVNGQLNPAYVAYYSDPNLFFGDASPTYGGLRAQPFFSEDLSLIKKTEITETTYFELRFEFFNAFNRGRFGSPNVNVADVNGYGFSGRLGGIYQPRRIQVGARFVF